MNITFLLGNGLDRALGLETGYNEFYEWYCNKSREGLTEPVSKFRTEIDKYIHNDSSAEAYWSDAEYGLGQYTEKFSIETVNDFLDCFDDFRDNLVEYLKEQEYLIDKNLAGQMRSTIAPQLLDFYQEIDPIERYVIKDLMYREKAVNSNVNFICFNYTNSIDKIVISLKQEMLGAWRGSDGNTHKLLMGELVHAHGTLEQWPIIGVCNIKNIKNQELLKDNIFKVVMQKGESIKVSGQLWRNRAKEILNNSTVICVFGMSLGDTDSDYWEMLTEWLDEDAKRHLIVFWYNTKFKNTNMSVREKYQEVNSVKERLFEFSSWTSEIFEKISNRIHVVIKPQKMFMLPEEQKANQKQKVK